MTTITFPQPAFESLPAQQVYGRTAWGDDWTDAGDLWCTRLSLCTGDGLSSAHFRWRFGRHLPPGGTDWETRTPIWINTRSYVRVSIEGTDGREGFEWYGWWKRAELGEQVQGFEAVGLETLMDVPCTDVPFWDEAALEVRWVGRGLHFNSGGRPNRSQTKQDIGGKEVYVFSQDPECTDWWSTRDAVELILFLAGPEDKDRVAVFDWEPVNIEALPDFDRVDLPTDCRSYLSLLRSLVPRYRLLGWTVEPNLDPDMDMVMNVRFFTFTDSGVDLWDIAGTTVGTIPANTDQDDLAFPTDTSSRSSLAIEASHVVDQVVARGDRRIIICSLSNFDGSLVARWKDTEEASYIAGASGAADYPPSTEISAREERDAAARANALLTSVFSWFGVPTDWDQTAGDGEGEQLTPIADDGLDESDEPIPFKVYTKDWRFRSTIPKELDDTRYFEDPALLGFVRIVKAADDPDDKDRWLGIDVLARCAKLEQLDGETNRQWSGSLRHVDHYLGPTLEIQVNGAPKHALAEVEFLGRDDAVVGAIDWTQDLIVTVAFEEQRRAEARFPKDEDLDPLGELVTRLTVEAPGHRLVTVRPYTVVGTEGDDLSLYRPFTEATDWVDDRDQLALIAQRTYEWHAVPRYALGFGTGWIDGSLKIGHLVTAITDATGTWPVNSVITEITLEFPVSQSTTPAAPKLSLTTAFAEMDAQRII